MQITSIYDTLLELPLFRGVSRDRISEAAGSAKFHFVKYAPDAAIIEAGEACTHIKFIISGAVRLVIANPDNGISVSQTLYGPDVILPDFLFGRATTYPCSVTAITHVSILQILKEDYLKILKLDEIYTINLLNYLSMNAQKSVDGTLALMTGDLEHRIAYWIIALTQPTAHSIELSGGSKSLCRAFGVEETAFLVTVDKMVDKGLIEYSRSTDTISVVDRRTLLHYIMP